jgi:decaprenylphospho-beta-D-ribofuranose 2-oxidase
VRTPGGRAELLELLRSRPDRGVVARGLGRSYGDPAQNAGGTVLSTAALDRVLELDPQAATVRVEPGVSLARLVPALLDKGWFVPVTPGTRHVSVGGALAADVHGKNHHGDGSIGRHIAGLTLALADGTVREVGPDGADDDRALFWGTLGGMGLTGVVLEATVRVLPVTSPTMLVRNEPAPDLDALLAGLDEAERHRYSVAWIDCTGPARRPFRGIVSMGDHADAADGVRGARPGRPGARSGARLGVPGHLPSGLLNRGTAKAFNEAWYRAGTLTRGSRLEPLSRFFYPLDGVADWNRLYGPNGLVQYQCVVPDEGVLRQVLELLWSAKAPVLLGVLKRLGAGNPGPLSFAVPGWTLAVDLPAGADGMTAMLDRVDDVVAAAGGRVYLAKDSRMRPEHLAAFYPGLDRWHALRDRVDPGRLFRSDQSRRLGL